MRSSWTYRGLWRQAHHGIQSNEGMNFANARVLALWKAKVKAGGFKPAVSPDQILLKKMQRRQSQRNLRFYKRHTRHQEYRKKEIDRNRASMAKSG